MYVEKGLRMVDLSPLTITGQGEYAKRWTPVSKTWLELFWEWMGL